MREDSLHAQSRGSGFIRQLLQDLNTYTYDIDRVPAQGVRFLQDVGFELPDGKKLLKARSGRPM